MPKSLINFVHANGFPVESYQTLIDYFPKQYQVVGKSKYGHEPAFPVENNWQPQVDELIIYVKEQLALHNQQQLISVGHSFGGVIAFIAACQQPHLFKGLVMIDSPVITGTTALITKYIKRTKLIDKFSPAGKSKTRRTHWPLGTDIAKLFARRSLFKNFDKRCLNDYINHGIVERNNQQELAFSAEIETEIFRHLPENLSSYKNKLTIPTTFLFAKDAPVFPHSYLKRFAKLNSKMKMDSFPGGHMFPLERPEEAAALIMKQITGFSQ